MPDSQSRRITAVLTVTLTLVVASLLPPAPALALDTRIPSLPGTPTPGYRLSEVPPEWGELLGAYPASAPGLVVASFSPLALDPDFRNDATHCNGDFDFVRQWALEHDSSRFIKEITTLWAAGDRDRSDDVTLLAASVVTLIDGRAELEQFPVPGVDTNSRNEYLERWREELLATIFTARTLADLDDPRLFAEVDHFTDLTGDFSVGNALTMTVQNLFAFEDCLGEEVEECRECCVSNADKRKMVCGALVGPLTALGACLAVGGPANPIACTAAGGITSGILKGLCTQNVERRARECDNSCSGQPGDPGPLEP